MKYWVYPNVAKAGGLQSQGVEGEAVVIYCEPLTTPDLMSSGLSRRVNNMATPSFAMLFMQPWGLSSSPIITNIVFPFSPGMLSRKA